MIGKNYHLAIATAMLAQATKSYNDNNADTTEELIKQLVDYLVKNIIQTDQPKPKFAHSVAAVCTPPDFPNGRTEKAGKVGWGHLPMSLKAAIKELNERAAKSDNRSIIEELVCDHNTEQQVIKAIEIHGAGLDTISQLYKWRVESGPTEFLMNLIKWNAEHSQQKSK